MNFRGTQSVNQAGHLAIGGVDVQDLANEFGTPLYVYDTELIKEKARAFLTAFQKHDVKYQVAYASKAFSTVAMIQLIDELGLTLDVVSGGELYTALKAGMDPGKIHFHGNNKSIEELTFAIREGIGTIVADNFYELALIDDLTYSMNKTVDILLRMTPGIEAHTHKYIMTGQEDSKFGFTLENGDVGRAIERVHSYKNVLLKGLHCHIGSQIFNTEGFMFAIEKIFGYIENWKTAYGYEPEVINVGGGFGIQYTSEDDPQQVEEYVDTIVQTVIKESKKRNITLPEIWIEPGRAMVGEAGTTLYTIGSNKEIPGVRQYIAVDGGMTDNIRPALYDAKYEAILGNRPLEKAEDIYSIAGKCCESGDMLIWDLPLPRPVAGDLLAVFCTGAYGYSMASQYNRLPKPAVVFVEKGRAELVVQRETYEDLLRYDLPLKTMAKK